MSRSVFALVFIFALGPFSVTGFSQEKGGDDETGPYQVIANWPEPFDRPGVVPGATSAFVPGKASAASSSAVFAESPNRINYPRLQLKLVEKTLKGWAADSFRY
jgi:hypothetical protein